MYKYRIVQLEEAPLPRVDSASHQSPVWCGGQARFHPLHSSTAPSSGGTQPVPPCGEPCSLSTRERAEFEEDAVEDIVIGEEAECWWAVGVRGESRKGSRCPAVSSIGKANAEPGRKESYEVVQVVERPGPGAEWAGMGTPSEGANGTCPAHSHSASHSHKTQFIIIF